MIDRINAKRQVKLFAAAAMLLGMSSLAQAIVVNVDITGTTYPAYSGTGAATDSGTYWNAYNLPNNSGYPYNYTVNPAGSINNLLASDGHTVTSVEFSLGAVGATWAGYNGDKYSYLFQDYAMAGSTPVPFTISGLNPGGLYDVYLYDSSVGYDFPGYYAPVTFAITGSGSQTIGISYAPEDTQLVYGENYTLFTVHADNSGDISGSFAGATPYLAPYYGTLSGLQIEEIIPEPSIMMLISFGGGVLFWLRRRGIARG